VIPESLEKLEIILDITHGINFQTFMTQKALFEIAQILAYFVDVKFRTLNSDPYSKEVEELNVNEIEEINVRPHIVIYRYENERKILSPSNLCESENEKEKIGRDLKCLNEFLNDEFYCFSSSFIFGLPLWVIYFLPKVDDMKEFLQKCFEKYVENIVVYKRNDTVEIRRKIELRPTIANVIKIYLVLLMLNKIGISQKIEILLEDIKILKQKIYEKAFPVESNRIDREISEISENREKMDDNYRVFSEIKGIKGKEKRSTIDKRNFFAHAGFEYNSFETKLQNGKIFLKPNDSLIENIKGHLKGALPKGG
ncbi:MAG: CRISPR-associated CARF protein Csx1, partial [Candidatus Aenigmatarchaeota archaeon]